MYRKSKRRKEHGITDSNINGVGLMRSSHVKDECFVESKANDSAALSVTFSCLKADYVTLSALPTTKSPNTINTVVDYLFELQKKHQEQQRFRTSLRRRLASLLHKIEKNTLGAPKHKIYALLEKQHM